MTTLTNIFFIIIRFALGALMIWGGINKFAKPMPQPDKMISLTESERTELLKNSDELKLKNYIFGMKQSGYAWQVLGIAEILGGLLLVTQVFSFLGALILLPVTLHIFLMHFFLEGHETSEVILTGLYFLANLLLILKEYKYFKPLLKLKVM